MVWVKAGFFWQILQMNGGNKYYHPKTVLSRYLYKIVINSGAVI